MIQKLRLIACLLVGTTSLCTQLAAQTFDFSDIQLWYGSGSNQSALVIDWNDGMAPLAFGYRWDAGGTTAANMLAVISAAEDRLEFDSLGFIQEISWDTNMDGNPERIGIGNSSPPFTPYWQYLVNNEVVAATAPFYDNWEINASLGAPFDGDASDGWSGAPTGTANRELFDGSWDGLLYADPEVTDKILTTPVPEPSALAFLLFGAMACIAKRRYTS